jgi:hypothetical protein
MSDRDEVQRFLGVLSSEEQLEAIESVGKFKCRKKLSSGAIVTFSYEEKRPKAPKAWEVRSRG